MPLSFCRLTTAQLFVISIIAAIATAGLTFSVFYKRASVTSKVALARAGTAKELTPQEKKTPIQIDHAVITLTPAGGLSEQDHTPERTISTRG